MSRQDSNSIEHHQTAEQKKNVYGRIAVIGAGAAGIFAAITASAAGAEVTVYEHREEPLKKLLMTGNGKCNLTNRNLTRDCYYSDSDEGQIEAVLHLFSAEDAIRAFRELGLLTREREGYVYPYAEQASAVREVLLRACEVRRIPICTGQEGYQLLERRTQGDFLIAEKSFDAVILACGGKSYRMTGSDGSGYEIAKCFGHRILSPFAGLVQLYCQEQAWQHLSGVRAKGALTLYRSGKHIADEQGEIQFTDNGISGIPVFQLSRLAVPYIKNECVEIEIDFLPELSAAEVSELLARHQSLYGAAKQREQAMTGIVNDRVMAYCIKKAAASQAAALSEAEEEWTKRLATVLKGMRITITGSHKLDSAQVTCGGVSLHEVTEQLESRLCPGLFFAGEMLDVDGICGGYNLQWAWASAYTVGKACIK